MAPKLPQTLTFLLTLTATTIVHAQNVTSCAELGCGANTKTCTLTNETYPLIGVAPILPSSSSSLPVSLSWVQGTRANDNTGLNNTWFDTFYLASPPPSSDTATNLQGGCALFFRTFNAAFPGGADASITTGTCTDAIRQECIDALTARAQDVDVDGEDDVCDALKKEFEEGTIDNACAEYAVDNAHNWKDLRVQSLSDLKPITEAENGTSDCWPIQPKTDDLTFVTRFDGRTDANASTNAYDLTPILTVFFGGEDNLVDSTQAQLTCMKALAPPYADRNQPGQTDTGAGATLGVSSGVMFGGLSLALAGLML